MPQIEFYLPELLAMCSPKQLKRLHEPREYAYEPLINLPKELVEMPFWQGSIVRLREQPMGAIYKAPMDIGEEKAEGLIRKFLDQEHYEQLLDETGTLYKPNGDVLAVLLRSCLRPELCERVRSIVRKAALRQTIASGNRGTAAGTGMVDRLRRDGSKAKIKGVPHLRDLSDEDYMRLKNATDGVIGYMARGIRGGEVYPCRLTMYKGALPSEMKKMMEFIEAIQVGWHFAAEHNSYISKRLVAQIEMTTEIPTSFLLRSPDEKSKSGIRTTLFTTVTCNRNLRTAAHKDKGDFKEGFGMMACLGQFQGCELVFPRYKAAVRYREGDILIADVHEVHGNTPLLNPDGTVPELDSEPERLVTVLYIQEKMDQCLSTPAE
jgi:hypothetical protein